MPSDEGRGRFLLILAGAVALAVGWRMLWPDLNRDFNYLHGWGHAQDADLARSFTENGFFQSGCAPIYLKFYDPEGHVYHYTHYPFLSHLILSLVLRAAPPGEEHRYLRIFGIALMAVTLLAGHRMARRLHGPSFAAWFFFFYAVNALVFFFGIFPALFLFGFAFTLIGYASYLRWRERGGWLSGAGCVAGIVGASLSSLSFLGAGLPIAADLLLFGGGRGRTAGPAPRAGDPAIGWKRTAGRPAAGIFFLILPILVLALVNLHYRFGIRVLTGKEVFQKAMGETISARAQWGKYLRPGAHRQFWRDSLTLLSPAMGILALGFFGRTLPGLARRIRSPEEPEAWKEVFLCGTLGLTAIVFAFPGSTMDHQFAYLFLLVPGGLAASAAIRRIRLDAARGGAGPGLRVAATAVPAAAVILTVAAAFWRSADLARLNNTESLELEAGMAIGLFTPEKSFVRVPVSADTYHPLLTFYARRNLLFILPNDSKEFPRYLETAVRDVRFELNYGAPVEGPDCVLYLPVHKGTLRDAEPEKRPPLPRVGETYEGGAFEIVAAGITARYYRHAVVEIEWRSHRPTARPLIFAFLEGRGGNPVLLGRYGLRADGSATSDAPAERVFRDAYLFMDTTAAPLRFRLWDRSRQWPCRSDRGALDIPLPDLTRR